ncbi:hypothetical protein ACO1O0_004389 [Amphichorda felina]
MTWVKYLPKDRIKWSDGINSTPIWPSEPDVAVIKDIVSSALVGKSDDVSVRFLADGAHHKIYEVTHPSHPRPYLFRVAVPVDPCLKLESEMATLEFLRQRTTIPVPRPIVWSSTTDNKLGYEWALVEKIPGVELRDVWREIPWEKKVQIIQTIASYLAQLWDTSQKFSRIGSLYFSTYREEGVPPSKDPQTSVDVSPSSSLPIPRQVASLEEASNHGFIVGPSIDGAFFAGRRRYLEVYRGPYGSCRAWLGSLIRVEQEFIRTARILIEKRGEMTPDHISEDWSDLMDEIGVDEDDFMDDYEDMVASCAEYERLLPSVFPHQDPHDNPRFCLHHCDLREANILVDPETFEITGIIDWEQTCTVPDWYGMDYPLVINKHEPLNPGVEPPVPKTYNVDSDEYCAPQVAERDRWEAKLLREQFDYQLENLGFKDWRPKARDHALKSRFIEGVGELAENWERSRYQLKKIYEMLEELEPGER